MTEEQKAHELILEDRSRLTVTGVTEVVSFDQTGALLRTALGMLTVHGRDLQLKALSPEGGQVAVEGSISALVYQEPRASGGWLGRWLG